MLVLLAERADTRNYTGERPQSGNGLDRCRDKTFGGYCRYVGLGILGRNLQVLGKLLIAREEPKCEAGQSRRGRTAA